MHIRSRVWYFTRYISSLPFAVGLLLLLALASTFGTFIEQDQSLDYYKLNYPEGKPLLFFITWKHIIFLGLNHTYSAYWFLIILFLFFLSLLLCTFSIQLPLLKNARRWSFLSSKVALEKKAFYSQSKCVSLLNSVHVLALNNYHVFHKRKSLYAYKGLVGRIAPIFVHFSIVFTLIGAVIGFSHGFMAQEIIPTGEAFHVQNFVKSGYFSSMSNKIIGKVDDFFIVFNNDQSIQQFFSDVSLTDNTGRTLLKRSISVNTPLRYNGMTFYQTDWRVDALRLKIGSSDLLVKPLMRNTSTSSSNSLWFCNLTIRNRHKLLVVVPGLNDELLVYDNYGELITVTRYGLWNVVYGVPVVFKDIMSSTGLQIKVDPGLLLAYLGFLVLILSILISYTSYSQIWISKNTETLCFAGDTNRAILTFEDDMSALHKEYLYLFRSK